MDKKHCYYWKIDTGMTKIPSSHLSFLPDSAFCHSFVLHSFNSFWAWLLLLFCSQNENELDLCDVHGR